ncbi:MAG: hypothetical protein ABIC95_02510 [archaeon]
MQYESKSLSFLFVMVAAILAYIIAVNTVAVAIAGIGKIVFLVALLLGLFGFVFAAVKEKHKASRNYYIALITFSVFAVVAHFLFQIVVTPAMQYFYLLSILIAIYIALLDQRRRARVESRRVAAERAKRLAEQERYQHEISLLEKSIGTLETDREKLHSSTTSTKKLVAEKNAQLNKRRSEIAALKKQASDLAKKLDTKDKTVESQARSNAALKVRIEKNLQDKAKMVAQKKEAADLAKLLEAKEKKVEAQARSNAALKARIEKNLQDKAKMAAQKAEAVKLAKLLEAKEKTVESQARSQAALKKRIQTHLKEKDEMVALQKKASKFERALKAKDVETEKQAELKSKYAKTLRNMRKTKKEAEELLVVSQDGESVHRPKCIAVRNIPKDNRMLIKNWASAKKEGYTGCKLCNPHQEGKVVIRNDQKYKFVASKDSDKLHKASCLLVKRIDNKDRVLFKTYKSALKKGYTACRVCNPQQ